MSGPCLHYPPPCSCLSPMSRQSTTLILLRPPPQHQTQVHLYIHTLFQRSSCQTLNSSGSLHCLLHDFQWTKSTKCSGCPDNDYDDTRATAEEDSIHCSCNADSLSLMSASPRKCQRLHSQTQKNTVLDSYGLMCWDREKEWLQGTLKPSSNVLKVRNLTGTLNLFSILHNSAVTSFIMDNQQSGGNIIKLIINIRWWSTC